MSVIDLRAQAPASPEQKANREPWDIAIPFELVMLAGWLAMTIALFAHRA